MCVWKKTQDRLIHIVIYVQTDSTEVLRYCVCRVTQGQSPRAATLSYDICRIYIYNGLGEHRIEEVGSAVLISLWKCLTSRYIYTHIYIYRYTHMGYIVCTKLTTNDFLHPGVMLDCGFWMDCHQKVCLFIPVLYCTRVYFYQLSKYLVVLHCIM